MLLLKIMSHLTESERNQVIGYLNDRRTATVARMFNVSQLTIYRLQQLFFDLRRCQRPPKARKLGVIMQSQEEFIPTVQLRNHFQAAQRIADTVNALPNNRHVSPNAVLHRMREAYRYVNTSLSHALSFSHATSKAAFSG